jgi:hypothetical protein
MIRALVHAILGAVFCCIGLGIFIAPAVILMVAPDIAHVEEDGSVRDFLGWHVVAPGSEIISLFIGMPFFLIGIWGMIRSVRMLVQRYSPLYRD